MTAEVTTPDTSTARSDHGSVSRDRGFVKRFARHPSGVVGATGLLIVGIVAALAPTLAPNDPFDLVAPPLEPPGRRWLMGSDALGHDVASQVIHGARA
jgi:peptide/nickel transport system permease protein